MFKNPRNKVVLSTVLFLLVSVILVTGFVPFALADPPPPPGLPPTTIPNPITTDTFTDLLNRILDILLVFIGPILLILIVYSALLFMTSGGDPTRRKNAQEVLKWAIIGFVIIVGAKVLIGIIMSIAT